MILALTMAMPLPVFALEENDVVDQEETRVTEEVTEPGFLTSVAIEENPTGTVTVRWNAFDNAEYYEVSSSSVNGGKAVRTEKCSQQFSGLKHGARYDFTIRAFDENDEVTANGAISITTAAYRINFNEALYRRLGNRTVRAKKIKGVNLRTMIKEKRSGYAVVQGGCTDGKYAYYLMVSTKTQKGRVLKVRLKDNKVIKRSGVLKTWHGNGMTYDSKRNKLVVNSREHRKQELTWIDASSLRITRQENVRYNNYKGAGNDSIPSLHQRQGLAAIAYVPKYDCYIALERVYHNLLIFDPDSFEAIGMARTNFTDNYPGTFQAMDADDKYVYLLLSYYKSGGKVQPYNLILALDWNSENLLPVVNASKSKDLRYVQKAWVCNNDGNGMPDAVIRINTKREAENIYHTTDSSGREHFYLSEYCNKPVYKTVIKKVKVKGKWKRKRVKKVVDNKRDDFVYDLGII